MEFKDYQNIWVYVETFENKPKSVGLELLGQARKLADELGEKGCAVVMASSPFRTRTATSPIRGRHSEAI